VKRQYEEGGSGLHVPSRNTGRGVYSYGKPKSDKLVSKGKPTSAQQPQGCQAQGLKGPEVITIHTRNQTI